MTVNELLNLLKENYCRDGQTDNDGIYRYGSGGNVIYLANDKTGGWAFCCNYIANNGMCSITKWSIDKNGKLKNCGKFRQSGTTDFYDVFKRSTKYAVITPKQEYESRQARVHGKPDPFRLEWKEV